MFKKAAVFTDIHLGMKGNSRVHNADCEQYIDWYIEQAKAHNCETGLFCGDWHHNRNSVLTLPLWMPLSELLEKLGKAFDKFYYVCMAITTCTIKTSVTLTATAFAKHIPGITVIDSVRRR